MMNLLTGWLRLGILLSLLLFRVHDGYGKVDSSRIWQDMAARAVLNNPQKAFQLGEKALKASISSKDKKPEFLIRNYEILAESAIRLFQPDIAFSQLFEAMEMASRYNLQRERIRCLLLMGRLNWILEDPSKSMYYFSEAVKLSSSAGDFRLQLISEAFLAYQTININPPGERSDFEKIRELLDFVSVPPVDTLVFAQASNLMGNAVSIHRADADLAIRYYQQAVSLSEQAGDEHMALLYGQNLAESLMIQGNYPTAEAMLTKILNSARSINSDMLVYSSLKLLAACAGQRLDYRRAYEWQKAYEELKSKHLNESQQRRTNDILQSYIRNKKEIRLKEQENARLAGLVESEKKLRKYQIYIMGALFILFVLTAFVVSNRIRLQKIRRQRLLAEQQNAELEILNEKLRQQSAEAQRAREAAEIALKAKADFISVITHEIKTPIHAVIAASHLFEDIGNSAQARTNLEILRVSAQNLYGLINNVLDFNKIESGKIELEPRPFSLQDLLSGIQMSFLPLAEEKGIDLRFRVDHNLPSAFIGDRLRIGQIFINLVSNAIKFTHKGFVTTEVQYQTRTDGKSRIAVFVKDSGIGISPMEKDRIFDFFSQANPHIPAQYGGSGLGLTIVSRLLALMGSSLSLHSEPGQGSEFSFFLELPETDPIFLRSGQNAAARADLSRFRVLFVDDVEYNRILAQRFFEKWHIAYDFARNGREALELAGKYPFDIILMDIRLPDGDGFDFSLKIRELSGKEHVPILAMTAADRSEISAKLQESGMQDYIGKPFAPDDLRLALEQWLTKTG
jgi:signal transduction histidine kinase/ActR/RegA family two-component response regulator